MMIFPNYSNKVAEKLIQFRNWMSRENSLLVDQVSKLEKEYNLQLKTEYVDNWIKNAGGKKLFDVYIVAVNKARINKDTYLQFERMVGRLQKRYELLAKQAIDNPAGQIDMKADWLLNAPYFLKMRLIELNMIPKKLPQEKSYTLQREDFYHKMEMGQEQKSLSFSISIF